MRYAEFKNTFFKLPFITVQDILRRAKAKQPLRNQLNRWQQRKLIVRLKRGIYMLNEDDRKVNPSRYAIAGRLNSPSYISLESALNFYGFIPEKVTAVTSVTTKKTLRIDNQVGSFIYQHIKPDAFSGFRAHKDESGLTFFIAEPEKAIVDFLYLNLKRIPVKATDIFEFSFRFQNMEGLRPRRIKELARLFANRKLSLVVKNLLEFIKKEAGE
jgi:hypothetical protein